MMKFSFVLPVLSLLALGAGCNSNDKADAKPASSASSADIAAVLAVSQEVTAEAPPSPKQTAKPPKTMPVRSAAVQRETQTVAASNPAPTQNVPKPAPTLNVDAGREKLADPQPRVERFSGGHTDADHDAMAAMQMAAAGQKRAAKAAGPVEHPAGSIVNVKLPVRVDSGPNPNQEIAKCVAGLLVKTSIPKEFGIRKLKGLEGPAPAASSEAELKAIQADLAAADLSDTSKPVKFGNQISYTLNTDLDRKILLFLTANDAVDPNFNFTLMGIYSKSMSSTAKVLGVAEGKVRELDISACAQVFENKDAPEAEEDSPGSENSDDSMMAAMMAMMNGQQEDPADAAAAPATADPAGSILKVGLPVRMAESGSSRSKWGKCLGGAIVKSSAGKELGLHQVMDVTGPSDSKEDMNVPEDKEDGKPFKIGAHVSYVLTTDIGDSLRLVFTANDPKDPNFTVDQRKARPGKTGEMNLIFAESISSQGQIKGAADGKVRTVDLTPCAAILKR